MTNPVRLRLIPYNARIIATRQAKGWTQKDVALLTGLSIKDLSSIETLRMIPSQQAMDELCSALEVTQDYLFPQELIEALREGVFDHRSAELGENQIARLIAEKRAGLLPPGPQPGNVVDHAFLVDAISQVLDELKPREKEVIELRFGLKGQGPLTLEGVGFKIGVNRERVRQIEEQALRKLRHPVRSKRLRDYVEE